MAVVIPATGQGDEKPTVATDLLADGHHQKVKLEYGVNGSATPISPLAPLPVGDPQASTAAVSLTSPSTGAQALLGANGARLSALFFNDASGDLLLRLGGTATTSGYSVKLVSQAYYELPKPIFTGVISGIWTSTSTGGGCLSTEVSA